MKVLELRIVASDGTLDEALYDIAKIIKQELPATGIEVINVAFQVTTENTAAANLVM